MLQGSAAGIVFRKRFGKKASPAFAAGDKLFFGTQSFFARICATIS
jgi:hypothetical protein